MKHYLYNKYALVGCIALVAVGWYVHSRSVAKVPAVRYATAAISRGTITVAVSGTGQVSAESQLDVKPQAGGRIVKVLVHQGQAVKSGDALVKLDSRTAVSGLAQARTVLDQAKANYDKLVAGPSDTDVASADLSVQAAQQAIETAKRNLSNATATQQLAVSKAGAALLSDDLSAVPKSSPFSNLGSATLSVTGSYTDTQQGSYIVTITSSGGNSQFTVSGLEKGGGVVIPGVAVPLGTRGLSITFSSSSAYIGDSWTIDLPNTRSASYGSNVSAYKSALENQSQALATAQASVDSSQLQLEQALVAAKAKVAPPTQSDILSARAQVESAVSKLTDAETVLANTTITAPFDGVVAKLSAVAGDEASGSTSLATIITPKQIAQVSLNEVDVAKVKVGQKATVTFSAIDGLELTGSVVQLDTIGTVTQNVVTYTVKVALDTQDERVRSGMSVSASILTAVKTDILVAQNSAVKTNANGAYVETLENGKPKQHNVQVGLTNDTESEVFGDVSEGLVVITQTTAATTTQTGSTSTQRQGNILQLGGAGGGGAFRGAATGR